MKAALDKLKGKRFPVQFLSVAAGFNFLKSSTNTEVLSSTFKIMVFELQSALESLNHLSSLLFKTILLKINLNAFLV